MFGLRMFWALEPDDDVPSPANLSPLAVLFPVAEEPAVFLTGRSSQLHPEVMASNRPSVVAVFKTATTKVEIEDVEFMVMGLILNNGL